MLRYFCSRTKSTFGISNRPFREAAMSKPTLFGDEASPPVRFVMITASMLQVELNFHKIDLFIGENKTEFYKTINPLQKVPALSMNGVTICDSHAIALHLCKINSSQEIYPVDGAIQAKVDEMLFYNATTLFPIDSSIFTYYFAGKWPPNEATVASWYDAVDYLESILSMQKWLAGDKIQLCDICCAMTLTSCGVLVPLLERHSSIKAWLNKMEELPSFEINRRGLRRLRTFVEKCRPKI